MRHEHSPAGLPHYDLYINGAWQPASSKQTFTVFDPANGQPLATCASASPTDVDRAIAAARSAFDHGPWPHTSPARRAEILHALADALEARNFELAEIESRNAGVPLRKTTYNDITLGIEILRGCAEMARKHPYEPLPWNDLPSVSWNFVWREPIGVCAQIIPWNYAFCMAAWKLGPALATGNTVVFKPSSLAPLSTLAIIQAIHELNLLPKGVVNLVLGPGGEVGEYLVAHPDVDKVAFTGSTEVGRKIMALAAPHIKRVTLELGGKNAMIILPDADLDLVVDGVLWGAFYHSGQLCEAGSRLLVPHALHDTLVSRLVERVRTMRIGDPMDLETDIGPLISEQQRAKVERYIAIGREEGATVVIGGRRPPDEARAKGYYVEPTIFTGVRPEMRIAREEIFGPVLAVIAYEEVSEAIKIANDSIYGLAASVWSRDLQQALAVAKRIRAGTVWINEHHVLNPQAPFGGYRQSGFGREMGRYGLDEYTEVKHIHVDLMQRRQGRLWWDTLLPE
ncbi:aldehyde dehydrogenase family protein [Chloroflexus aggregans]|uniref:Aldehyde Dehydrogenase n=1 Tax=Chloroflexus aggregans (strain MD-66 / DSM 9485) TaxID=326427 RepID=B8G6J6_CHLAD|nr:aldehyde dehydrogenase family protein [Chloroflexus aggregans]ACL23933.1 Aldehyde Dehydrogenase [Chloroflexus aggregans DSM 9485]